MRRMLAVAVLLAGLLPTAHAEVWGYVDAKGVAHFAAEKLDERYELFFRGGESFDTAQGIGTPRPVAVPTVQGKLLAYFDVSPGYKQVKHHMREAASVHGVDYELLQALIATESGFDAQAVSPKGAMGLMQLMPTTAARYGVTGDKKVPLEKKLFDAKTNIRAGTRYLADLIRMFPGQLELAVAAYNAGENAVVRAGNKIPNYRETQNYVKTVLQLYTMLKPPATAARGRAPNRVHMELPAHPVGGDGSRTAPFGGAVNRGNMPAALPPAPAGTPVAAVPGEAPAQN